MDPLSKFRRLPYSILSIAIISILMSFSASGQSGTSAIRGTISDAQGNVVAGATVRLKNDAKSFSRTVTSDSKGTYVITALPPDTYVIEIEAQGFKKTMSANVKSLVDSTSTFDFVLE